MKFICSARLNSILFIILFITISFSQNGKVDNSGRVRNDYVITSQDYISSEDGTLLMYVNVWGHVKNPGTYLVYENIDLLTLISLAGGPISGANLKKINIVSSSSGKRNSSQRTINLNNYIANQDQYSSFLIKPHDTIYIKETYISYFISKTNLLNTALQILNLTYTISRLKD